MHKTKVVPKNKDPVSPNATESSIAIDNIAFLKNLVEMLKKQIKEKDALIRQLIAGGSDRLSPLYWV